MNKMRYNNNIYNTQIITGFCVSLISKGNLAKKHLSLYPLNLLLQFKCIGLGSLCLSTVGKLMYCQKCVLISSTIPCRLNIMGIMCMSRPLNIHSQL